MTDGIVEFIEAQLGEDEATAEAWDEAERRWQQVGRRNLRYDNGSGEYVQSIDVGGDPMLWSESIWVKHDLNGERTAHIARHDPVTVLADVKAKRAILAEVLSWQHDHVDGDSWLSCAQAVNPHDEDGAPGSGCADESRAGGPCDCGLDRRRATMLHALAAGYVGRPGFKPEWRLS